MQRTIKPKGITVIIESNNVNEFGGKIFNPTFERNEVTRKPILTRRKVEPKPAHYSLLITLIESKKFTRDQIVERITRRFPEVAKVQLVADLMNGMNPKYNKFPKLLIKGKNDFLSFSNE